MYADKSRRFMAVLRGIEMQKGSGLDPRPLALKKEMFERG